MDNNNTLSYWLSGTVTSLGANARELLLAQAEEEYKKGNHLHAVFYQVRGLYQTYQHRLLTHTAEEDHCIPVQTLVDNFNEKEKSEMKTNPLLIAAVAELRLMEQKETKPAASDFLQSILNAEQGVNKIANACQQFPKEWTIVQICKSSHSETLHASYRQIHLQSAPIYFTILRHARSADYPLPVVICIDKGDMQCKLFQRQGDLANGFKHCIDVDPATCNSRDHRKHFWRSLDDFDKQIKETLMDMKNLMFPWSFLLLGQPNSKTSAAYSAQAFKTVDELCAKHVITNQQSRVLLSLAALHVMQLTAAAIEAVTKHLLKSKTQQAAAQEMLVKLQLIAPTQTTGKWQTETFAHYPCILIVDERLDHFLWEEMFVQQEYTRVNSLQFLLHLHDTHKQRIKNGYLQLEINSGACIINPDKNLSRTEMRMKSFMQHWRPQWQLKCGEPPEQDELFNKFFKNDCYIYAGHGSGLQYINGKYIAEQRIESVVFLFGCDSTRMHSQGLYSELIGPHMYYQAALW